MASHRITLGEFQKMGGAQVIQRCALSAQRVALLMAASKEAAQAQLAAWHEALVQEAGSRNTPS